MLFDLNDYVYVDNFYLQSGTTITDHSGIYMVTGKTNGDTKEIWRPTTYAFKTIGAIGR